MSQVKIQWEKPFCVDENDNVDVSSEYIFKKLRPPEIKQ